MTLPLLVGIGVLGGFGAIARYLVGSAVAARAGVYFPFGTLVVNLTGSFALGVLAGAAVTGHTYRLAATGFLGAYTTFSTWVFETERLGEGGAVARPALNLAGSLLVGLGVVWLGRELGTAL